MEGVTKRNTAAPTEEENGAAPLAASAAAPAAALPAAAAALPEELALLAALKRQADTGKCSGGSFLQGEHENAAAQAVLTLFRQLRSMTPEEFGRPPDTARREAGRLAAVAQCGKDGVALVDPDQFRTAAQQGLERQAIETTWKRPGAMVMTASPKQAQEAVEAGEDYGVPLQGRTYADELGLQSVTGANAAYYAADARREQAEDLAAPTDTYDMCAVAEDGQLEKERAGVPGQYLPPPSGPTMLREAGATLAHYRRYESEVLVIHSLGAVIADTEAELANTVWKQWLQVVPLNGPALAAYGFTPQMISKTAHDGLDNTRLMPRVLISSDEKSPPSFRARFALTPGSAASDVTAHDIGGLTWTMANGLRLLRRLFGREPLEHPRLAAYRDHRAAELRGAASWCPGVRQGAPTARLLPPFVADHRREAQRLRSQKIARAPLPVGFRPAVPLRGPWSAAMHERLAAAVERRYWRMRGPNSHPDAAAAEASSVGDMDASDDDSSATDGVLPTTESSLCPSCNSAVEHTNAGGEARAAGGQRRRFCVLRCSLLPRLGRMSAPRLRFSALRSPQ